MDIVLDGGSTQVGVESTIVDLSTDPPELLRPGAIGLAELQRLIPTLVSRTVRAAGDVALASPGTLARHYSPRTPLRLFDGSRHEALDGIARAVATAQGAHRRVALLVFDGDRPALTSSGMPLVTLGEERDAGSVAARLYGALRECDALGCDQILCRLPETHDTHPLWPAIVDRLRRAATAG